MKILLLSVSVALAAADVSHLLNSNNNNPHHEGYHYENPAPQNAPESSYGAPQASVLGSGSVQTTQRLNLLPASVPSVQFNTGIPSQSSFQVYQTGSSGVVPNSVGLAEIQVSTPIPTLQVSGPTQSVPSVNLVQYSQPTQQTSSSYQFLSGLSQQNAGVVPSLTISSLNGAQLGSDASFNSGSSFGTSGSFGLSSGSANGGAFVSGGAPAHGSAGSINEAFGVSGGSSDSVSVHADVSGSAHHAEPEVTKQLYFFAAPQDEEEEVHTRINLPPVAPKKTYRIIFIKAPSYRTKANINVPASPANEEKTLVYVLVKKPEDQANVHYEQSSPAKQHKPEVFFIKYKTQKEAEAAVAEIQSKHGASGHVIANLPAGVTAVPDLGIGSRYSVQGEAEPSVAQVQSEQGASGVAADLGVGSLQGQTVTVVSQPSGPSVSFGGAGFVSSTPVSVSVQPEQHQQGPSDSGSINFGFSVNQSQGSSAPAEHDSAEENSAPSGQAVSLESHSGAGAADDESVGANVQEVHSHEAENQVDSHGSSSDAEGFQTYGPPNH